MAKTPATTEIDLSGEISAPLESKTVGGMAEDTTAPSWLGKAQVAKEWITRGREGIRPWREFFRTEKFRPPGGVTVVGRRLVTNIDAFKSNYLVIFVILFIYCVLTSPVLLIALAVCFGCLYFIKVRNAEKVMVIAGREVSPALQYAGVAALSFPLFFLAGAGSAVFWVIGASVFLIVLHAVMYASEPVPGAEFLQMETV